MLTTSNKFQFSVAPEWVKSPSNKELFEVTQETDFSKQINNENKDFCFYLNKVKNHHDNAFFDYSCVIYSITQSQTLEIASVEDIYLEEFGTVDFHRITVIREGEIIDKIPDTKIKIFDNENQSQGGVYNNTKKINVAISDLRLYDIIIVERTINTHFAEKEYIRNEFLKHIFVTPEIYWGYGEYRFEFQNNTSKNVAYQSFFFRNEQKEIIAAEKQILSSGESYVFFEKNYNNPVDPIREVYPFIDFATDADWQALSNFIHPLYNDILASTDIVKDAPEIIQAIEKIDDFELRIKYAINYVQNNIKYIFDANEMNGHKPQEVALTYKTKQGDCKAKTVFLKALLDYIGVDTTIIALNYQNDFYIKYYLPSLLSFNHVILKINHNRKTYFVDSTFQDEQGILEKRGLIQFYHYLEVKPNSNISIKPAYAFNDYCIEETINYDIKEDKGSLTITSVYRFNRANAMRRYFKSTNKREILESWINSIFYCLNFNNDRDIDDIFTYFINPEVSITSDDITDNKIVIDFKTELHKPYFTDRNGKRFMMFFDFNMLKKGLKDFKNSDMTYWHGFESEKYDIHMSTDLNIDTKEKFTCQEIKIENSFFTHEIRKDVRKTGASAFITYNPVANIEIPAEQLKFVKEEYAKMEDSNFGLGIDILNKQKAGSIFNKINNWFS